ncbi:MAG TPA: winged helix-turn-helix transcriptional regulator [Allosphingosinicella sp.]|nr:winged helix-turn-helix transcriptional regulator [Allosphingosinicella sp.]
MELEKITDSRNGPSRRRYDDACGTAHALDLIGERWALLVMRELMLGPKRFSDIRADLPGISANTLTQRLEGLEAVGLVRRRRLPPPASARVYELTQWGYEAEPIVQTMGRWATRSPAHDPTMPLSATSLMLSFRTMGDPARMKGLRGRIGFRIGAETFRVEIADSRMTAERGPADGADLVFTGPAPAIAGAVYGGVPIEALEAEGALKVEGDRKLAARFVTLFPLPAKAG